VGLSTSFKKEEVFYLSKEVKYLIDLLNGTILYCDDKTKLRHIEEQIIKLENLYIKFEPTIYDEYSSKTKLAYKNMIKARDEYDRVVAEKCFKETIEEYRKNYEDSLNEYKRLKEYRDRLKEVLSN
jgi:hypothetical protein